MTKIDCSEVPTVLLGLLQRKIVLTIVKPLFQIMHFEHFFFFLQSSHLCILFSQEAWLGIISSNTYQNFHLLCSEDFVERNLIQVVIITTHVWPVNSQAKCSRGKLTTKACPVLHLSACSLCCTLT